jgi:kumamolisin
MCPVDPERIEFPGSECRVPEAAKYVSRTSPQQVIRVSVMVRRRKPLDLAALGGRVLSREEYAAEYGADPEDFASVERFAAEHGLAVDHGASSLARRTVVLCGTAEQMERAFGVELHDYKDQKRKTRFHAFAGRVSIPKPAGNAVEAVLGLDARPVAEAHFRFRRKGKRAATAVSFDPPQVAALYSFPQGVDGTGQTIGIVELGGGYRTSDLQQYFAGLGLKAPAVTAVSVDGAVNAPGNPQGADGEVALDIEVAGSIAPGAKIAVYFAPNTEQGFVDAVSTAVHDATRKPGVISISWGGPESGYSSAGMTALDNAAQSAVALGVTITVAAGDNGSSDGVNDGQNHVDFPASSPHVLACGGTRLTASGTTIKSEVVWNDGANGGATGGGVSAVFALPSWQANAKVPGGMMRGVPDVAGDASPNSGYNVLVDGQQEVVGGTSSVAPLWAALIALVNEQKGSAAGFVNPALYGSPGDFHDIVKGNNGVYSAGPGWDACTGLGSPVGTAVATALK